MLKSITVVSRCFNVYNEKNELIYSVSSAVDLKDHFNMSNLTTVYKLKNTGTYFKPCLGAEKIRVDYIKEKIESFKVEPYIIKKEYRDIIKDLPNEIWKNIPGYPTCNFVSNMGRFKIVDVEGNTKFSTLSNSKNKTDKTYYDVSIENPDGKTMKARASRVIAKTFLDSTFNLSYKKDKRVVDHINNDSTDNRVSNLRILNSNADNIKAAIYEQGKDVALEKKECYAYNINSKELRDYPSTAKLCEDIFKSKNKGYFNNYYNHKLTTRSGWRCGYNSNELKGE